MESGKVLHEILIILTASIHFKCSGTQLELTVRSSEESKKKVC